ncbi:MAG: phage tail tape measure C-terminal domain-containing protein [Litorimonas sp.]
MNPVNDAADALDDFANGAGADAANALATVFEEAGERIAGSLEHAAQSGELSFNALAESVLNDLARIAVNELITAPLQAGLTSLTSSIAGTAASKSAPVTVNLNMTQPVGKFSGPQASGAQIAGQIAQAVVRAQTRN